MWRCLRRRGIDDPGACGYHRAHSTAAIGPSRATEGVGSLELVAPLRGTRRRCAEDGIGETVEEHIESILEYLHRIVQSSTSHIDRIMLRVNG